MVTLSYLLLTSSSLKPAISMETAATLLNTCVTNDDVI